MFRRFPFLLFLFPLFLKSKGEDSNSVVTHCPEHRCGDVLIRYPFWKHGDDTRATYCGYPGFGINCDGTSPIFHMSNHAYFVKDINYTASTLTLVDNDVRDNPICPRVRHNVTLGALPLSYSILNLELVFYFNCTSIGVGRRIECLRSNQNRSQSYYTSGLVNQRETFAWYDFCEEKVVAMVIVTELKDLESDYGAAMKEGFWLDWRSAKECIQCEEYDGKCVYTNTTTWELVCLCPNGFISKPNATQLCGKEYAGKLNLGLKILVAAISVGGAMILAIVVFFLRRRKSSIFNFKRDKYKNVENFLKNYGRLAPKRYNYSQVKKITGSFRTRLGDGGYGSVYKGKLPDGTLVAVKFLNDTKGNGEEFINEVASISRTSHVNIVKLLGFCFQGKKRALIYEFMPNGSLEKFIYDKQSSQARQLGWLILYKIAVGIARGLEYLHRGCNTQILHFDIKPHNILLDEEFSPKISDFGLSQLCTRTKSIVSILGARGTIGYIAPEVVCRTFGGVSHKADVYSYGMMILEMVGGRKNVDAGAEHTSEIYYPHWVYKQLEHNQELGFDGIVNEEDNEKARKMIIVSLWCIQTDPSTRPSMGKVVEMLEGNLDCLQVPPKPYLYSPTRSAGESLSLQVT